MVIAALVAFGLLLAAWIAAPTGPRPRRQAAAIPQPLPVPEAA